MSARGALDGAGGMIEPWLKVGRTAPLREFPDGGRRRWGENGLLPAAGGGHCLGTKSGAHTMARYGFQVHASILKMLELHQSGNDCRAVFDHFRPVRPLPHGPFDCPPS